jgi:LysR family cyn operon transcriptional activator
MSGWLSPFSYGQWLFSALRSHHKFNFLIGSAVVAVQMNPERIVSTRPKGGDICSTTSFLFLCLLHYSKDRRVSNSYSSDCQIECSAEIGHKCGSIGLSQRPNRYEGDRLIYLAAMDLRQLEMFIAVADNSSFTGAGRQLHVAQSAISRKIGLLEYELGEPLFKRVNKKIFITPAGEMFLRYARRIFQDLRNATMEISEFSRLEWGHLGIGAGLMACIYILPPVLEKFKALHPRIELEIATGSTDALLSKLRNNSIEIGVFTLPLRGTDLEVIPLCEEEMVVVVSRKYPVLSKKRWINAEEIPKHPLIIFSRETHTRYVLEEFFHEAGIVPQIVMEIENVAMIKPLIKIDMGISIIPLSAVVEELKRKELHCLRIRGRRIARQMGLVYLKSDPTPKVLLELIRLFIEVQAD